MKNFGEGYSTSTKAAGATCTSLTPERIEALKSFLESFKGTLGDLEIVLPSGELFVLSMRGKVSQKDLREDSLLFQGKVNALVDTLWEKSVKKLLFDDWEGSLNVLNYGELRHQMAQMARSYKSQASHKNAEEKAAYMQISKKLSSSEEVRKMLSLLGKVRSVATRTFEVLRGQGGKIRIVVLK